MIEGDFLDKKVMVMTKEEQQAEWNNKPHLVLPWIFDYNTLRLTCQITDTIMYEAPEGGTVEITKYTRATVNDEWTVEKVIPNLDWANERYWISENYGEKYGYYQPNYDRFIISPRGNVEGASQGFGPDLRYIDHLQRLQAVMEGEDCSIIDRGDGSPTSVMYETPDNGKTIYKREVTKAKTLYAEQSVNFYDHPQPCAMQPHTIGRQWATYDELQLRGINQEILDMCKQGKFADAPRPDLQEYFVYPNPK